MLHSLTALLPYLLIAGTIGYFGKDRKFGFWGNFAASMVLTPIGGIIVLLAQDKKACEAAA